MSRYGYSQEKCDSLKRERKNLTNKLYRRRVKEKQSELSLDEIKEIAADKSRIKAEIDALNSKIWKCSKQYLDLKKKEVSKARKIYYRKKMLDRIPPSSERAQQYRSELYDLHKSRKELRDKIFYGSDRYRNVKINFSKLSGRIKYLKKMLESGMLDYVENGEKKQRPLTKSERMSLIDRLKKLGDEKRMLEEAMTGEKLAESTYESVDLEIDYDRQTETHTHNIFIYRGVFDVIISRRLGNSYRYNQVNISGDRIGNFSFDYPSEELSIQNALNEGDSEYGEDASRVQVVIFVDNYNKTVSLTYEYIEV